MSARRRAFRIQIRSEAEKAASDSEFRGQSLAVRIAGVVAKILGSERIVAVLAVTTVLSACDNPAPPAAPPPVETQKPAAPVSLPADFYQGFSGENAFAEAQKQIAIGPRWSGSQAIERARIHIIETLERHGWQAERQSFKDTPVPGRGEISYTNIIGRFSATKPAPLDKQRVIMGSHYDTAMLPGIHFIGANDGASSTGALLELARLLATVPTFAEQFELAFFDGEEAMVRFSQDPIAGPDGLVGSRHYAGKLRESGRARQFRFMINWDMIGDKNLGITLPADTPPKLAGSLFTAAEQLGTRRYFGYHRDPILDDHTTVASIARVPAMDIIDFDFPQWHSSGDTEDKISARSIEIIARTTVKMLMNELGN